MHPVSSRNRDIQPLPHTEKTNKTKYMQNQIEVWSKPDEVRKLFAPNLSETEFQFFMGLGQKLGANPFTREIWALKYGSGAATIFCGRDFYRRKAQEQANYNGHVVEAVYENDDFRQENGIIKHSFGLKNRGALLAAYCIVKRKGIEMDYYSKVLFSEYNSNQSNWKTKPESMLKKVAEAQALRAAFQGVFEGTYDESEETKVTQTQEGSAIVMASEEIITGIESFLSDDFLTESEELRLRAKLENKENLTQADAQTMYDWCNRMKTQREAQPND